MLATLVWENLKRQRSHKLLAVFSVITGIGIETALLNVTLQINDRLGEEMRRYGANILVLPAGEAAPLALPGVTLGTLGDERTLDEAALTGLSRVFWKNNFTGVAPFLYAAAREARTGRPLLVVGTWFAGGLAPAGGGRAIPAGVRTVCPWWRVDGAWPGADGNPGSGTTPAAGAADAAAFLVGAELARDLDLRPGARLEVRYGDRTLALPVAGVLTSGGFEDGQAFAPLAAVQRLLGRPGAVAKVLVSALTAPEAKAPRDPDLLPAAERERWSCTPFPSTIAHQIQQSVPGCRAEPILAVSRAEGGFLSKVHLLMVLVTALGLVAAALGVGTTMSTVILGRRREIALMRTLGGSTQQILLQFFAESAVLGLAGGALGYGAGVLLARGITFQVFGVPGAAVPTIFPCMLLLSVAIVLAGVLHPTLRTLRLDPVRVLKEA